MIAQIVCIAIFRISNGLKRSVVFPFEQAGEDFIPFWSAAGTHTAATMDECAERRGLTFDGKLCRAGKGFWWWSCWFGHLGGQTGPEGTEKSIGHEPAASANVMGEVTAGGSAWVLTEDIG